MTDDFLGEGTIADNLSWKNCEFPTREAIWVCIDCKLEKDTSKSGGIVYKMTFAASKLHVEGTPKTRKGTISTTNYFVSDPVNQDYIKRVIQGQMMQTSQWDWFCPVYQRD
jgi:hypothetical protein